MRILVVDDELVSRAKLQKNLEAYGQCESAAGGRQALELIDSALASGQPYDLVTLDVAMPGMNGNDLLLELRRREKASLTPGNGSKVLMVTAHGERSQVVECMQSGCDDYVIKPVKPDDIRKKLRILGLLT